MLLGLGTRETDSSIVPPPDSPTSFRSLGVWGTSDPPRDPFQPTTEPLQLRPELDPPNVHPHEGHSTGSTVVRTPGSVPTRRVSERHPTDPRTLPALGLWNSPPDCPRSVLESPGGESLHLSSSLLYGVPEDTSALRIISVYRPLRSCWRVLPSRVPGRCGREVGQTPSRTQTSPGPL